MIHKNENSLQHQGGGKSTGYHYFKDISSTPGTGNNREIFDRLQTVLDVFTVQLERESQSSFQAFSDFDSRHERRTFEPLGLIGLEGLVCVCVCV